MILLIILIFIIGGVFLSLWFKEKKRQARMGQDFVDSVFLEILVPKDVPREERQNQQEDETKHEIAVAEQLFTTLSQESKESLSFEIINQAQKISFFIHCPKHLQDLVEKQVHAQYPDALISEAPPPALAKGAKAVVARELTLQKKYIYPVKTYKHMESDPLSALTNSLSKLSQGEAGVIQLVIMPAGSLWRNKVNSAARAIQKGKEVDTSNNLLLRGLNLFFKGLGELFSGLSSSSQKHKAEKYEQRAYEEQKQLTPMQQEAVKRLEEKTSKSGFEANLRVVITSTSEERAKAHMRNVLSSFTQYTQSPFNGFKTTRKSQGKVLRDYLYRGYKASFLSKMILNTEELAGLYHLPTPELKTPHIKWLKSKQAPPPVDVPKEGLLLGHNTYRGVKTEIRMLDGDRRRHMYIVGRTGTGKSEFVKNLAIQDIRAGKGVGVIDPHGDLVDDLLPFIPKSRVDDVVLFEPFDTSRPMGLNMLEAESEEEKDFAVQEMIAIFYKLFPPEMIGPMFEHNMRNVMLTLMADREQPGTLAEIPRMFTDQDFQKYKLTKVRDPVVRNFWEQEMAKTSDFHKSEMLGYLISKVGRFVENEMMRNIIGQSRSAFDFRKIMDEGKIFLINLSKGKTGEVNAKLLGLILVSKLQMAALARADLPQENRRDFYLYIDEFQNFVTDSIATILSEARKYRLNLVMAHQYISQLVEGDDTKVRDSVFGNTGTIVSFRIGVEDAEILAKEFEPVFNEYDVINIDRFHAYVKLMINGTASRPFNMAALPPRTDGSKEITEAVRKIVKLKYGRPRDEVREEIRRRSRLGELGKMPDMERTP